MYNVFSLLISEQKWHSKCGTKPYNYSNDIRAKLSRTTLIELAVQRDNKKPGQKLIR